MSNISFLDLNDPHSFVAIVYTTVNVDVDLAFVFFCYPLVLRFRDFLFTFCRYNARDNRNLFVSWTLNNIKPNLPAGAFMFNSLQYTSFYILFCFFAKKI